MHCAASIRLHERPENSETAHPVRAVLRPSRPKAMAGA